MLPLRVYQKAQSDYHQLDGSQKKWVKIAIERCVKANGQIGDLLSNTGKAKLHGCKKLKNNKLGLRIIFRINKQGDVEIIEIIAIDRREDYKVYIEAEKRLQDIISMLAEWTDSIE